MESVNITPGKCTDIPVLHEISGIESQQAASSPRLRLIHKKQPLSICTTPYPGREKSLSSVQLFATPWTVAHQAPPSMGFSRQEYWSRLPFSSPGDLPDPGIEEDPGLLHCRQMLYQLNHQGILYPGKTYPIASSQTFDLMKPVIMVKRNQGN